jgi:hypothetical protein
MKRSIQALVSLVFFVPLAATAAGQTTELNVTIEKVTGATVCPGVGYKVAGADVLLQSSSVDLERFVLETVRVTGHVQTPGTCPPFTLFLVDSVTQPTATLAACGVPRPGCPLGFQVGPPTISINWTFWSIAKPGFLDLGPPIGVGLLGAPVTLLGTSGPLEVLETQLPPGTPIGLTLFFQSYHLDVGPIGGPGALSNAVAIQTIATGIPCVPPDICF